jgi:5-methylcytosine-specific restriction endonuclease McrA
MNTSLHLPVVLVLNRNWQAIDIRTPAEAFCQLATGAATALDVEEGQLRPVDWSHWLRLPVREGDRAVRTVRGAVRVPTVVITVRYARVPRRRPRLTARSVRERDGGRCQYTGRLLGPGEGNLDHVLPRSRGGTDTWENLVWSAREVNTRKGNRLPQEAGLQLLRPPSAPRERLAGAFLHNTHAIPEWDLFLTP